MVVFYFRIHSRIWNNYNICSINHFTMTEHNKLAVTQSIVLIIICTIGFLILQMIGNKCFGQRYQDTNRGLFPNALQGTINARNTAIGIRYSYLFQKSFMGIPCGLYGSFSNTIKPDRRFINYPWERKYSLGGMITLPYTREMHGIRTVITVGAVYNSHPDNYLRDYPGLYDGNVYYTNNFGCDLGLQIQVNHFVGHIAVDAINFMRYVEIGIGFTFFKLKH